MVRHKSMGLLTCACVLLVASLATAGIPDLGNSTAATLATETVSVYCLPNGGGHPLNDCYVSGGAKTDATITLTLLDSDLDPVFAYPFEDMWLEGDMGGLVLCAGGSTADANTDLDGVTTFSLALFAGGQTDAVAGEVCAVIINGDALTQPGLDIRFNSPDINGDLNVNLTDVVLFSQDYYSGNTGDDVYSSDFYWDGNINLSDIVLLSQGSGSTCP